MMVESANDLEENGKKKIGKQRFTYNLPLQSKGKGLGWAGPNRRSNGLGWAGRTWQKLRRRELGSRRTEQKQGRRKYGKWWVERGGEREREGEGKWEDGDGGNGGGGGGFCSRGGGESCLQPRRRREGELRRRRE
ncbi:hypothetical protein ACJIZ3_011194 [Penstemon smallii]|uniref:Uncharacterized protein n=1 Tax=Penstemon smallii TaxID=265156 RepID=A0ABD3UJU8_9LAMI